MLLSLSQGKTLCETYKDFVMELLTLFPLMQTF